MPSTTAFDNLSTPIIPARNGVKLFARVRGGAPTKTHPLIVMIHGYPQSSHMYRYVGSSIPEEFPLFIPDIPGYGDSIKDVPTTETEAYSKREIGGDILDALKNHLSQLGGGEKPWPIILIGHDRGARIIHRLIVDEHHPDFDIMGAVLMDIVPTIVQFASFANPPVAAATFHWPFLAGPYPMPEKMIAAFGGDNYIEGMIGKWSGIGLQGTGEGHTSPEDGISVYKSHFQKQSVINASCADYRAAALVDSKQQTEDQAAGRKIKIPLLVLFSETYLGSRYDVSAVWKEWVAEDCSLTTIPIKNKVGHFMSEESPDKVSALLKEWINGVLGVKMRG